MTDLAFRGEVVAGLIAIVRAWQKGLTGVDLAREVRCGFLMAVRAIEKKYPELTPPQYKPLKYTPQDFREQRNLAQTLDLTREM